jgi:hypothetical protein
MWRRGDQSGNAAAALWTSSLYELYFGEECLG